MDVGVIPDETVEKQAIWSSTKGPLQTMLAASVHLSPCFSTDGL